MKLIELLGTERLQYKANQFSPIRNLLELWFGPSFSAFDSNTALTADQNRAQKECLKIMM